MSNEKKVYKKILEKLTPEYKKQQLDAINSSEIPQSLQRWINEYREVGERNNFIWKWVYKISQAITLDESSKKYKKSLWEVKFLMIMFIVLLDDVADKLRKKGLLFELLKIPTEYDQLEYRQNNGDAKKYFRFTLKLWRYIEDTFSSYPRFNEFKEIIMFDIEQALNSMRYSFLINNNPFMINKIEYQTYLTHNMQYTIDVMIDLCCCKEFDMIEMGRVREIAWCAQQMTRIGNWISTWEREIDDNDFTSGVFAYAIDSNVITPSDLKNRNKTELVSKIERANINKELLEEWEVKYEDIKSLGDKVDSIDIKKILKSLEYVLSAHIISKGYK